MNESTDKIEEVETWFSGPLDVKLWLKAGKEAKEQVEHQDYINTFIPKETRYVNTMYNLYRFAMEDRIKQRTKG